MVWRSPIDLKGDDAALSDTQKEGLALFMNKGCASCHNGVNIGGASYARFGVVQLPGEQHLPRDDLGRFEEKDFRWQLAEACRRIRRSFLSSERAS